MKKQVKAKRVRAMLPSKLSELILVALKDLEKVEKDEKYEVNMIEWHSPNYRTEKCEVCLAGAIMAKSLKTNVTKFFIPNHFGFKTDCKLQALNTVSSGYVSDALLTLKVSLEDDEHKSLDTEAPQVCSYSTSPAKFKRDMKALARYLKSKGY